MPHGKSSLEKSPWLPAMHGAATFYRLEVDRPPRCPARPPCLHLCPFVSHQSGSIFPSYSGRIPSLSPSLPSIFSG